ncbi:MAG TPA: hypothetical protein VJN96_11935 [Vicinamibacterales bacterium]|nr:hypothetical protein [Vicinamibacterales bacterium]
MARFVPLAPLIAAVIFAEACGSPSGPHPSVTVLVTNASCQASPCATIRVLGFPQKQPQTPGGLWSIDLGIVDAQSACLSLPESRSFTVTDASTGRSTSIVWTTDDPIALGTVPSSRSLVFAEPSTPEFVPAAAPGWTATLPGATAVTPGTACEITRSR